VNPSRGEIAGAEATVDGVLGKAFTARAVASHARGHSENGEVKTPLTSIDPVKATAGRTYRDPNGRFGGHLSAIHSACGFAGRSGVTCSAT